jgi:hypothetical protein
VDAGQARLRLVRVLWGLLGVTPLRFVFAAGLLVAAIGAGASSGPARIAFVFGLVGGAGLVLGDPRRRFLRQEIVLRPAPDEFELEEPWRSALRALYPSSLGLTVLGAVALAFNPLLSALLAGVTGGLGVAGLVVAVQVWLEERRLAGQLLRPVDSSWTSRERGAATLFVLRGDLRSQERRLASRKLR